jgi:hypothetical protein
MVLWSIRALPSNGGSIDGLLPTWSTMLQYIYDGLSQSTYLSITTMHLLLNNNTYTSIIMHKSSFHHIARQEAHISIIGIACDHCLFEHRGGLSFTLLMRCFFFHTRYPTNLFVFDLPHHSKILLSSFLFLVYHYIFALKVIFDYTQRTHFLLLLFC